MGGKSTPPMPAMPDLPAPAAANRAPTIDGPVESPGVALAIRRRQMDALVGRQKLVIPMSANSGGSGMTIPQ